MLHLDRFIGERIVISGGITVTVLAIHEGKVRLEIDAPPEIEVHREEIARRIASEGRRKRITPDTEKP